MNDTLISCEALSERIPPLNQTELIAKKLGLPLKSVTSTRELLLEGATIPFIARYRKDVTGGLDEVQIEKIRDEIASLDEFEARRLSILTAVAEQEKLTPTLFSLFMEATTKTELEDLYLPYKRKRLTRAAKAREKGLAPLADIILGLTEGDLFDALPHYVDPEKGVNNVDEALAGAKDIVAELVSEKAELREALRDLYAKSGLLTSKLISGKEQEGATFSDYFEYDERVATMPSHRILAVTRGEKEEILRVHVQVEPEKTMALLKKHFPTTSPSLATVWEEIREDSFKRLLHPSMEAETRRTLKHRADEDSIKVFAANLRELLMAPPLGQKSVLALDPGFRTGCKVAILSPQGDFKLNKTIYPHPPRSHWDLSKKIVSELCKENSVEAIAIGNGTAGRETEKLAREIQKDGLIDNSVAVVRVDESGASIYSASPIARDEFPDLDLTVRGAISIGRRLQDPLGELVKLDPKSIGVGQYQHDVDQSQLKQSLDSVVLNCVNKVGVELNSSSPSLLQYVAGLGPSLAKAIVAYRESNGPFKNTKQLLKVPRLGPKAFEQCAGFLRIHGAENPLDASGVHPESYAIVERMAKDYNVDLKNLIGNKDLVSKIDVKNYYTDTAGKFTLEHILEELLKPGRDPREKFETIEFREDVMEFEDLEVGMILKGVVTNVTGFGCFVDVGVHQDGLVHVSELAHRFVKDPMEVVKPGMKVTVKIIAIDERRKRISMSIKACLPAPDGGERRHRDGGSRPNQGRGQGKGQGRGQGQNRGQNRGQGSGRRDSFNSNPFANYFKK